MDVLFHFWRERVGQDRYVPCLCMATKLQNWQKYYDVRKVLRVIPYEKPKPRREMCEEHGAFFDFASRLALRIVEPRDMVFLFPYVDLPRETRRKIVDYARVNSLPVYIQDGSIAIPQQTYQGVGEFLRSAALDYYRAVQAYAGDWNPSSPFVPGKRIVSCISRSNYKHWFKNWLDELPYFFLFHLEVPVFSVWGLRLKENQIVDILIEEADKSGIELERAERLAFSDCD